MLPLPLLPYFTILDTTLTVTIFQNYYKQNAADICNLEVINTFFCYIASNHRESREHVYCDTLPFSSRLIRTRASEVYVVALWMQRQSIPTVLFLSWFLDHGNSVVNYSYVTVTAMSKYSITTNGFSVMYLSTFCPL